MRTLTQISQFISKTFVVWILLFAVLAYLFPPAFVWIAPFIPQLLGVVMFGMGLTVSGADFKEVFTRPLDVAVGVAGQFAIMPALAYVLAKVLPLPDEIAVGFILVGCCPGGTASNVMTFLARGDVALSVTITSVTTFLAPLVTPALIYLLASQWIAIDAGSLLLSILQIVLFPLLLGLVVQRYFAGAARTSVAVLPLLSVVAITAIVAAVVAASHSRIADSGLAILSVVVLHNLFGYLFGYALASAFGMALPKKRAIAIEVGMQNSGLGAALATAHFSPLAAVPSAIFSVWHNISGPLFAAAWRRRDDNTA
jgi:bile acid:Na+ symporter, BASS family